MDNSEIKLTAQSISESVNQMLRGKSTLYEAKGITKQSMDGLYAIAHNLYKNGKYEDALRIFRQLCFYDHSNIHYWLGLGYSQKMLKDYRGALATLIFTVICFDCDDQREEICLHIAECFSFIDKRIEAMEYATEVMKGSNQLLKDRASVLLEAVSSR